MQLHRKINIAILFYLINLISILNDIATYINKRGITADLNNDDNYIINYLKVSAISLYAELQEQYGQFSENTDIYLFQKLQKNTLTMKLLMLM